MPDIELKSCPFCKGVPTPYSDYPGLYTHSCDAFDNVIISEHGSVTTISFDAWNTRATEDALRSRMAEARVMLDVHPLDDNTDKLQSLLTEEPT